MSRRSKKRIRPSAYEIDGACVCGHEYVAKFPKKPTVHTPVVTYVKCICDSDYMLKCYIDTKEVGSPVKVDFVILHQSEIAQEIVKQKILKEKAHGQSYQGKEKANSS